MATHSSIAQRIPWTEEPGGLQSMGLQRVGHDWSDLAQHKMYFRTAFATHARHSVNWVNFSLLSRHYIFSNTFKEVIEFYLTEIKLTFAFFIWFLKLIWWMKKNLANFLKFPVYEKLGNAISLPTPTPFWFTFLFMVYSDCMEEQCHQTIDEWVIIFATLGIWWCTLETST